MFSQIVSPSSYGHYGVGDTRILCMHLLSRLCPIPRRNIIRITFDLNVVVGHHCIDLVPF